MDNAEFVANVKKATREWERRCRSLVDSLDEIPNQAERRAMVKKMHAGLRMLMARIASEEYQIALGEHFTPEIAEFREEHLDFIRGIRKELSLMGSDMES